MKKVLFKLNFAGFANQAILIALMLAPSIYGAGNNDDDQKFFDALLHEKLDTVKELIKSRPSIINSKGKLDGNTPLELAAGRGSAEAVKLLINKGAEIDAKNNNGETVLMSAAIRGREDIVELLLKAGANIEVTDNQGNTALIKSARFFNNAKAVSLLINNGANVNAQNEGGETALMWAARRGYGNVFVMLLKAGANIEMTDNRGNSALIWAAKEGFDEAVQSLINKGADVNAKNKDGETALMLAAFGGEPKVVKLLINKKANVNAENKDGDTALMLAIKHRDQIRHASVRIKEIVDALLLAGANKKFTNNKNQTALMILQKQIEEYMKKIPLGSVSQEESEKIREIMIKNNFPTLSSLKQELPKVLSLKCLAKQAAQKNDKIKNSTVSIPPLLLETSLGSEIQKAKEYEERIKGYRKSREERK